MKTWLFPALLSSLTITSVSANQSTLEKNLAKEFPNISTKVLGPTPINNMYAVALGDSVLYTDENARYFFIGNLVDYKNKTNLTEQVQKKLGSEIIKSLPLEQAIKFVKGDGSRSIYVFSDPDCPYCKKLEQNMTNVDNVTLYTFLYPLKGLHPNAENVAAQIWCADKPYEAWEDYMILNKAPTNIANCDTPIEKNLKLGAKLGITGTPTIFFQDGSRVSGALSSDQINQILDGNK